MGEDDDFFRGDSSAADSSSVAGRYGGSETNATEEPTQWVQIHQTHYDRETGGEFGTAIVFGVAEAKDVDPLDHARLPPLNDYVDADALEKVIFGQDDANYGFCEGGTASFGYDDCKVVVRADGWIFVYEAR